MKSSDQALLSYATRSLLSSARRRAHAGLRSGSELELFGWRFELYVDGELHVLGARLSPEGRPSVDMDWWVVGRVCSLLGVPSERSSACALENINCREETDTQLYVWEARWEIERTGFKPVARALPVLGVER